DFEALPGLGVKATVEGREVLMGNADLMDKFSIQLSGYADKVRTLGDQGKTVTFLAVDREAVAIFGLADTVKESAGIAVKGLKSMGWEVVMGESANGRKCKAIAQTLGI